MSLFFQIISELAARFFLRDAPGSFLLSSVNLREQPWALT
jgi:hypothetical protein